MASAGGGVHVSNPGCFKRNLVIRPVLPFLLRDGAFGIMKIIVFVISLLAAGFMRAEATQSDVPMHDPSIIRQNGRYYIFATGMGVAVWSSSDLVNWKHEAPVFAAPPAWATAAIPGFKGHIWAPDISLHDSIYYLYYSVSAFGKNTSAIGLATNPTLDPGDPAFQWVDHGKVIQSVPGVTNWNAIDPNLIADEAGTPYLVFGSFWEGLKLVKLTEDRMKVAENLDRLPTLATRKKTPDAANPPAVDGNPVDAGGNAIEAPFIFKHTSYYYLFASIDYCCKGARSDYKMIVGRAKALTGPYLDRPDARLDHGGGTILLAGDPNWYGVGHNAVANFDGTDYLVFHGYDAADPHGRSKLRVEKLSWDAAGWPAVTPRNVIADQAANRPAPPGPK
jgi:arabinan endo-1,5-alpha-L-arabinosidase